MENVKITKEMFDNIGVHMRRQEEQINSAFAHIRMLNDYVQLLSNSIGPALFLLRNDDESKCPLVAFNNEMKNNFIIGEIKK